MNLKEQIYRSRKLMVENHQERLSLVEDLLNDFLNFDGNISYKTVYEDVDELITGFSVEATIDSSMYHMVSPNYNPEYSKFLDHLDDKIYRLVSNYLGDDVQYEVVVFFHENVEKVVEVSKPMLKKAMDVYSRDFHYPNLKFKFISNLHNPALTIFIEKDVENGLAFNHTYFVSTLNDLYYDRMGHGIFDDFYVTAIEPTDKKVTKIYESVIDDEVICDNCGWSWELSDGGKDPYTCHKCGHENKNPHD
jgi:hypothetical protein